MKKKIILYLITLLKRRKINVKERANLISDRLDSKYDAVLKKQIKNTQRAAEKISKINKDVDKLKKLL